MDLSSPISSVVPGAYGPILAALVRAGAPLSGRQIAALVDGQVSRSRVNSVLGEMADSGLVSREPHPPAVLYRFNREHVAAPFVEGLADLRRALQERIQVQVAAWTQSAVAVWMFGSAARGQGSVDSDIDILVVRPEFINEEDPMWGTQLAQLADDVRTWSGNPCTILEMSESELDEGINSRLRLIADIRRDAVWLGGAEPASLLRMDATVGNS